LLAASPASIITPQYAAAFAISPLRRHYFAYYFRYAICCHAMPLMPRH